MMMQKPHTSKKCTSSFQKHHERYKITPVPNSSDLAPCGYNMFGKLKDNIKVF